MSVSLFKKVGQAGMLSMHTILPIAAMVLIIGAVGAYVLAQSHAAPAPIGGGGSAHLTCSYSSSPTKPVRGKSFTATVTIKNIGNIAYIDSDAPYYDLSAWPATHAAGIMFGNTVKIGTISAGATKKLSVTGIVPATSQKQVTKSVELSASRLFLPGKTTHADDNCLRTMWPAL